ncbi:MAG: response regulator [Ferruginibacter sp.]
MSNIPGLLNILLIEDNSGDVMLIEEMLRSSRVGINNIYTADRTAAGCAILKQQEINLVLVDLSLPDSHGIESFLKIKDFTKKIPVIILTGLADSTVAIQALKEGAQDYLVKGEFETDILVKSIQYSIERKLAEEKIIASEEKYRQMFYKNPFPAWIYDISSLKFLEVNDAAIDKYGYERNEFLSFTLKDIRPVEDIPEMMESLAWRGNPDKSTGNLWRHRKKNGDIMMVEVTFYKIDYLGRIAIQAQINDVTEKISLEKELLEQQKIRERQITDAVLGAQEKERKGIGEELHDNINQVLATSKLFLSAALTGPEVKIELITKSRDYLLIAMEEIRKLSKILITPVFIESGLMISVNDLVENILTTEKIKITTEIQIPDEKDLSEPLKLTIYRIIQEQLNNILKHAEASVISIQIRDCLKTVLLSVHDNGKGFDTGQHREGIGFTNMSSRAGLYNGKVEIDSSPGNGCLLSVELYKTNVKVKQVA